VYEGCVKIGRASTLTTEGENKMHANEESQRPKCSVARSGRSCVNCLFCRTNRAQGSSQSNGIDGDA